MAPKNMMFSAFLSGWIMHTGLTLARQDWLGLDHYLRVVTNNWVDMHWAVGGGIALAAWIFYGYLISLLPKEN